MYSQGLYAGFVRLLSDKKAAFEVVFASLSSTMFVLSVFLPWWRIESNLGAAAAPISVSPPFQSWGGVSGSVSPNWYLTLPVFFAAVVSLLFAGLSWKEGIALYVFAALIVPGELLAAQGVLLNYFMIYLDSTSNSAGGLGGSSYFTGTPGMGIVLYLLAYATLTILLVFKLVMQDPVPLGKLKITSILVVFSGFFWYLIGSTAYPSSVAWAWVMALDMGFILTTGLLLWSARRKGWLSILSGWRERVQFLVLPLLVVLDALTTNYALPVSGSSGPLSSPGTSVRDASLLVNAVQTSGFQQVAYLFWTLLVLQVLAFSYLTLGLAVNEKLRSFSRFLASYALHMMIAAYAFTVSNNLLLIFTGRTWFANSEALVLVIALAVTSAFILSVSNVWGLTHLGDLKREWSVHF